MKRHSQALAAEVTGHVLVKGPAGHRKFFAHWIDRNGSRRTRTLGPAHVRDSGRRTARGAVIWRAADGPCPPGYVTPKAAEEALHEILEQARQEPLSKSVLSEESAEPIPTFGDAVEAWLTYLRVEKRRKPSTLRDAEYVADGHLLPRFGRETPLYKLERHEVIVIRNGRQRVEIRDERIDTFGTRDVDAFRRDLLTGPLSPRSVQKVLVLLHGVFKLAKRRGLVQSNPSADAERVTVEDPGTFNVLA